MRADWNPTNNQIQYAPYRGCIMDAACYATDSGVLMSVPDDNVSAKSVTVGTNSAGKQDLGVRTNASSLVDQQAARRSPYCPHRERALPHGRMGTY